ncbi:MAG TPA: DUF4382 domain-containing protein [Gemmatimonadaceae bacterium]|nr:DUF4382 domain-containing protein [Gemmatimonadaceae bacterium]
MMYRRSTLYSAIALAAALTLPLACSDSGSTSPENNAGSGTMIVRLTDAPFSSDSVKSVNIFVVRVDARGSAADSASTDHDLSSDSLSLGGWQTVASPNASFDLLSLQNGVAATIGQTPLPAGTYSGFRLVIDPTRSSVTLKNGMVLTGTSSPSVTFPSAARSGLKIVLAQPVQVVAGTTTNLLVDFDVSNSFVQRGNSIEKNGLIFKPVIRATITNTALTDATIKFVNATESTLNLLQSGTALTGASNLAFGQSSSCTSVNAATPALSVVTAGSTTALPGFSTTLAAGNSFDIIAYPNATGGVSFATVGNAFTPTSGQAGLRVFNATSATTGYDVYLTSVGAPLGSTATVSNVLAGNGSAFVSVPAGAQQIRLTSTGGTTVLLDLGSQTFTAGQNATLVVAPPAAGSLSPRAFVVTGC